MQHFTPLLTDAARFTRHAPAERWYVDETYIKVNGVWRYVYRAIDQHGRRRTHLDSVAAAFTELARTI
ncbi:DDE-type integrase/transposase/recombinase [Dactylosporangium roseum]|uniref:DDE-type integrase/transposase/recombinase n=1 Tax=Dactylosporangium roseum TaxID=47989 RepID=A0ABY5ZBQ4_9ACTN|nr:DDE-type integrase/transposase/recombinase [Dactylosporangium roseum]UWZ39550.1 DDE-type integrase/transposase/recombinase [Dactylosporangium roseum]